MSSRSNGDNIIARLKNVAIPIDHKMVDMIANKNVSR